MSLKTENVASFLVPTGSLKGNTARSRATQVLEERLAAAFRTFSSGQDKGVWTGLDGAIHKEPLLRYDVVTTLPIIRIVSFANHLQRLLQIPFLLKINNDEGRVFGLTPRPDTKHTWQCREPRVRPATILRSQKPIRPRDWPTHFDIAIQTVIGTELEALRQHLELEPGPGKSFDDFIYYRGEIRPRGAAKPISIVAHCQGVAGNDAAAIAAERLITLWRPKFMFLVGIAAGRVGRIKIGDVVTPRVVVDDTSGVAQAKKRYKRPLIYCPPPYMRQVLSASSLYNNEPKAHQQWHARLFQSVRPPRADRGKRKWHESNVARNPTHHEAGIYSSNLLLKDPNVLEEHAAQTHQQIKIGEMEAAGFAYACGARRIPIPWLIVRGVSDFGDTEKSDRYQRWAAHAAASFLAALIVDGEYGIAQHCRL